MNAALRLDDITAKVLIDTPAERVARVTLNDPARRNAIDADLRGDLIAALTSVFDDPAVRAVVLTGAGPAFCAGGDIASMDGLDPVAAHRRMRDGHRLVRLLAGAPVPVVSAVAGWAVGAGAGLAALSDTVVAGGTARFGFPFITIGLVPDYGLSVTLPWRVGHARARQLLMYGRTISAAEALTCGLVDEVVDDIEMAGRALDRAVELSRLAPFALQRTRELLRRSLEEALVAEASTQAVCLLTDESAESRRAFRERRPPQY